MRRALRGFAPAPPDGEGDRGALATLLCVIFLNLMGFGIVVPLLPFYAQSFHAAPWQIALLFSAFSLGGFFGEPVWGRLSDRIGRRPLLISTVLATATCYLLLAFAQDITTAFLIRLLGGMASGNASVIQGYIADVTPADRRSGRMAYLGAAFNIGFIVGPAIGGLLARPELGPTGFRIPLLVASALGFCSALGVLLFVRESRRRAVDAPPPPSRWRMATTAARHPVIGPLILVTFAAGFGFTGIESTFGLWGQARFGWGPHQIGLMFGGVGVVAALCQSVLTGAMSRRFGEGRMLAAGMALSVTASFCQVFSTGILMSALLLMASALGNSLAFPNVSALISRVTDPDHQGQMLGLNNAAGAFARVAGPYTAGLAFAEINRNSPFVLAAMMTAPAIALALIAGRAAERRA